VESLACVNVVQIEIYLHIAKPALGFASDFPSIQSDDGFQLFDKPKEDLYVLSCHEIYHGMFKNNSWTEQTGNSQSPKASEDKNEDILDVTARGNKTTYHCRLLTWSPEKPCSEVLQSANQRHLQ
jgi:hypothetical protein